MGIRRRENEVEVPDGRRGRENGNTEDKVAAKQQTSFISEAHRKSLRYYNAGTGKCDLTEEQADEQERRREVYNRACDEESERRRRERMERWRNTPLDPAVQEALHGTPPEVAWAYLQCVLFHSFDAYPEQAEKLMEKYQPPYDQESLNLMLQNLNPKVGLSNFLEAGEITDLSDLIHKADPLEVLEQVLWMVTISSKWQSEVVI
jgi:hypothetical protein